MDKKKKVKYDGGTATYRRSGVIKKDKAVFTNNDGVKETHTAKFDRKGDVKKNTVKVKGQKKVVTKYKKGGLVQFD
tara:strand:+ start:81 stop:308 length:228 start_codon:yes stop_codon:yes gene_type:complete